MVERDNGSSDLQPSPRPAGASEIGLLSARDPDVGDVFPAGFDRLYEVYSYRNAARIFSTACKPEFDEIVGKLMQFRIETGQIVKKGRNKSEIAKAMDALLNPLGWAETRISGDLLVRKHFVRQEPYVLRAGPRKGQLDFKNQKATETYRLPGFIDGHKIDFIKGRVAFDMEWNSKDQTFDRDLYAMRAFYECGIVSGGILLTRSKELVPMFAEISKRVTIDDFKSKFGASTTWMGKLTYRLDAGRGGGCPILALGIKPTVVSDFDSWLSKNRPIREAQIHADEPVDQTVVEDEDTDV